MKNFIFVFFLAVGCATTTATTSAPSTPEITIIDTIHKSITLVDTFRQIFPVPDSSYIINVQGMINVKDFGAYGDGKHDDYLAIQTACNYCILHPIFCTSVRFPVGHYFLSQPIILQNVVGGAWKYFTIKLIGDAPAKCSSDAYLSVINCNFRDGFGIGIQKGRDIEIQNLSIQGLYSFPSSISNYNIGTTLYSAWNDGSVTDTRYAPYSGICIDPFCDSTQITDGNRYSAFKSQYLPGTGRGGTSGVKISWCAIHGFPVGVMLTPNGYTQNDEMIQITDDNVDGVKVAIAIGQDQSKTISIKQYKCWASTFTILDGVSYGAGTGGGSVFGEDWNIAGNVNELFNLNANRFPLSVKDIYSESLFRIGAVGWMANLINCQIDFLSGPGMPAADYFVSGTPVFYGGMLRYYDNSTTHRMNLNNLNIKFRDMTLNTMPLTASLYGYGANYYPKPTFDNIFYYYGARTDTLIKVQYVPNFTVDRNNWIASFDGGGYQVGDYILASPTSTNGKFFDSALNPGQAATIQIGRVSSIVGTTIHLDDVGLNAQSGNSYDAIFISRLK